MGKRVSTLVGLALTLLGAAVGAAAEAPQTAIGQTAAGPAAGSLALGQVIEKVVCRDDPSQSYALFLPSSYRPDRPAPILYAFDPGARGRVPVELFSKAAERLGYIVAGSNNSRNGPSQPILAAVNAVWADTHARLAIDPRRIYSTGMSGGNFPARLVLAEQGAGIIACAGAIVRDDLGGVNERHAWIFVAGESDFNFDLNRTATRELVARGFVARFVGFDGGHSWPPEPVASRALDWLELAAMRSGRRAADPAFVDAQLEAGRARANELASAGQPQLAAEESAALARELAGLKPEEALRSLASEAERLDRTPGAKKARKREQSLGRNERTRGDRLRALRTRLEQDPREQVQQMLGRGADDPLVFEDPAATRRELDGLLEDLVRDLESPEADRRIVSRRVVDGFYIDTLYRGQRLRDERRLVAARANFEICVGMRPKAAGPLYDLARTHAALGDRKQALARLREAVALGFRDLGRLEADPEWAPLRGKPELQAIASSAAARE